MAAGQLSYLNLVNRVLMRLGKSQIANFTGQTGDTWGGIVRDFLNDAQAEVAKEHDWSTLYTSGTFSTSSRTYDLSTSFSNFGREVSLTDTTNNYVLEPTNARELDVADPDLTTAGVPRRYAIHYPSLLFDLTPTSVSYRLRYLKRATTLSVAADVSTLPEYCDMVLVWWAVWQLQASREDAQDGGERAKDIYEKSLARAIGQDRRRMDRVYRMGQLWPRADFNRPLANLGRNYEPL